MHQTSQILFILSLLCLPLSAQQSSPTPQQAEKNSQASPTNETPQNPNPSSTPSAANTDPQKTQAATTEAKPEEIEALEPLPLGPEELIEAAPPVPQISLHAVYDENFPAARDTRTREMVLIMAQQWQFPEVRENLQVNVEPLVNAAQLELSSYEEGPLGPALRLQFNRAAGRTLEAWARVHHGQRLAVIFEGKLLVAEPATEGLGRRIHVPLYLPIRRSEGLNWDGRSQLQRDRDTRDQQAFEHALELEASGILDWGRRGITLGETMDSALDGDVLSNRLLAWIALNSGGEADQQEQLAQLCWLAARDQMNLWARLLNQWPHENERQQIIQIIQSARPESASGDPAWENYLKAQEPKAELTTQSKEQTQTLSQEEQNPAPPSTQPPSLDPSELHSEANDAESPD